METALGCNYLMQTAELKSLRVENSWYFYTTLKKKHITLQIFTTGGLMKDERGQGGGSRD